MGGIEHLLARGVHLQVAALGPRPAGAAGRLVEAAALDEAAEGSGEEVAERDGADAGVEERRREAGHGGRHAKMAARRRGEGVGLQRSGGGEGAGLTAGNARGEKKGRVSQTIVTAARTIV